MFKAGKPLADYSKTLTSIKDKAALAGNKALRTVAKLLTNSLYGKFASKYFLTQTNMLSNEDLKVFSEFFKVNSITRINDLDNMVNFDTKVTLDKNTSQFSTNKDLIKSAYSQESASLNGKDLNISIAAAITSLGRVDLYRLIQEIVKRGGKVCYVDTDSIFATGIRDPFNKQFGPYT